MNKQQLELIEECLRELTSTLHKECIDTGLITYEQWNEEIAPKLKQLANVINGYNKDSPSARSYKRYKDDAGSTVIK